MNKRYLCSMKKLVIVGCGRLAGIVSDAVVNGLLPEYDLVGVYSRTAEKAERIVSKMQQHGKSCVACTTPEDLLALKPDYLVEAASPAAMKEFALPALKNGTSIVTLSIGALADTAFYQEVMETAKAIVANTAQHFWQDLKQSVIDFLNHVCQKGEN